MSHLLGRYGKGYIPVPERHPDGSVPVKRSTRALLGAPARLPDAWDGLSQHVAAIHAQLDQKSTNACVGFSLAVNVWLTLKAMGVTIPLPSMLAIYFVARARFRSIGEPLIDVGCSPDSAVFGLSEWGVPSITEWPFDPATVNDEPDVLTLEKMYDFRVPGHWYIDSQDDQAVIDTKHALSLNMPVSVGSQIDDAFEAWEYDTDSPSAITAPNLLHLVGGHMTLLVGYETRPNGETWFKGLNWWGDWGMMGGFFWANQEWLKQTTDRTVLQVARTGRAPVRKAA